MYILALFASSSTLLLKLYVLIPGRDTFSHENISVCMYICVYVGSMLVANYCDFKYTVTELGQSLE